MKIPATTYYRRHGYWSDPKGHGASFDDIPATLPGIAATVQGLMVHDYFGAKLYANPPHDIADASRATQQIAERLASFDGFGRASLTRKRPSDQRRVGTCRDFALLTTSILRHHGIAARVRCGFARYFHPPTYEDHWICEYHDLATDTWKKADAQLDPAHKDHLGIRFDTMDMPQDAFLFPWQVWERCWDDIAALQDFGHGTDTGFWFLRVSLARDVLALTQNEVSSWDSWRDHSDADKEMTAAAIAQCETLAAAGKALDRAVDVEPDQLADLITDLQSPHWQH